MAETISESPEYLKSAQNERFHPSEIHDLVYKMVRKSVSDEEKSRLVASARDYCRGDINDFRLTCKVMIEDSSLLDLGGEVGMDRAYDCIEELVQLADQSWRKKYDGHLPSNEETKKAESMLTPDELKLSNERFNNIETYLKELRHNRDEIKRLLDFNSNHSISSYTRNPNHFSIDHDLAKNFKNDLDKIDEMISKIEQEIAGSKRKQ